MQQCMLVPTLWLIPLSYCQIKSQSLRTELYLSIHPLCCCYTPVRYPVIIAFTPSIGLFSAFWKVRFKKRSKIEQKDIIKPMTNSYGLSLRIIRCTLSHWQPYRRKLRLLARIRFQNTLSLEVVADLPHRMRLFWLRCQIMRLRSVSHQTALFSKCLWLRIIGLIWKGYKSKCL